MNPPLASRIAASTLALTLAPLAHAGVQTNISEAVEEGHLTVLDIEALETSCETFTVDAEATRRSQYRPVMSIQEGIPLSDEDMSFEMELSAGESIEVLWTDTEEGPIEPEYAPACQDPAVRILDGAERPVVLQHIADDWAVDPWYVDDSETSVTGTGDLPPCGEAEQDAVIGELLEEEDDDETQDALSESGGSGAGCSTLPAPAVAPLLAMLGLAGLVRRRER